VTQQFTGERLIPGETGPDLWNEHFARYAFASPYCRGKRVLDAGCGAGYGAAHLAQPATRVTAIDVSTEAICEARRRYPIPNLQFEVASATSMPFADASFDVVTSFEVIEHLEDWNRFPAEAARVLAPDGVALISTPNREYYTASRGSAGTNPFHVHEFAAAEFEDALRAAFPSVTVFLQNRSECIAFYPHRVFSEPTASLESSAGSPETAHFFLAVCGRSPESAKARPFVFVPKAANVLREREQHIALLERQLTETKAELASLLDAHCRQQEHLEQQNRWALATADELRQAQERIVRLQDEYQAQQDRAQQAVDGYERALAELNSHLAGATNRLNQAHHLLALTRQSRWVRMGRAIGLGPDLPA
jgi:ubiquinone/menaquinone biosynthesis C-methylase UbiE